MIPIEQWLPTKPEVFTERSPSNLRKALAQFSVETHARYKPFKLNGRWVTWCNIFRWDGTTALGCELPHWYDPLTGEPRKHHAVAAAEMRANDVRSWLHQFGAKFGWKEVSRSDAQLDAMRGLPVLLNWFNSTGSGHEAFMLPDGNVIQAGRRCGVFALEQVFPQPLAVTFWRHS